MKGIMMAVAAFALAIGSTQAQPQPTDLFKVKFIPVLESPGSRTITDEQFKSIEATLPIGQHYCLLIEPPPEVYGIWVETAEGSSRCVDWFPADELRAHMAALR
jgi:hypothetical protein